MTTEVIPQTLQAGVQATFGQGRIWYIKSATAALTIIAERQRSGANVRKFLNVGAGFKFTAPEGDGWTYLRVTSAVTQNIEIIIGDDDVEVANAVTVSGAVAMLESPASTVADTPAVNRATATQGVLFAANPARRRMTVFVDGGNTGSCFARVTGGANNIGELVPGLNYEFKGTYALDVRNDTGAPANFYIFEET